MAPHVYVPDLPSSGHNAHARSGFAMRTAVLTGNLPPGANGVLCLYCSPQHEDRIPHTALPRRAPPRHPAPRCDTWYRPHPASTITPKPSFYCVPLLTYVTPLPEFPMELHPASSPFIPNHPAHRHRVEAQVVFAQACSHPVRYRVGDATAATKHLPASVSSGEFT